MSEVRALPTWLSNRNASDFGTTYPQAVSGPGGPNRAKLGFISRSKLARQSSAQERGYSLNLKQVFLAFAVELFIIGLILIAQYNIAEDVAQNRVFAILLFPIALAVVELARVPLAIATRTQKSWGIKLLAALGVIAAVTVTSFSLSTIAYQTFDPRLIEANDKNIALQNLKSEREISQNEISAADREVDTRRKERDAADDQIKGLRDQISKVNAVLGKNCKASPDNITTPTCTDVNLNAAQSKTLMAQLKTAQSDRDAKDVLLKAAETARAKYDLRSIDQKIAKAESDYRMAVTRSQLHS
jgi:hypothetical protein